MNCQKEIVANPHVVLHRGIHLACLTSADVKIETMPTVSNDGLEPCFIKDIWEEVLDHIADDCFSSSFLAIRPFKIILKHAYTY